MSDALLRVRGLRKEFVSRGRADPVVAVDAIDFDVDRGGSLAIVGESGSGKTTIARMLLGLERPSAGSIQVDGRIREAGRISRARRRRQARDVQIVFQDPYTSLDPRQRVAACLDEVLALHTDLDRGSRRRRALDLLEQVGLDERHAESLPSQLSGGQRQRVAIARALAPTPKILVLDEAVSALDVSVQSQVLNLLNDIRSATSVAYVFISHDLAVVRNVSDDIAVMRHGRFVEVGSTARVLSDPQDAYTRRLLDSLPRPGWTPERTTINW